MMPGNADETRYNALIEDIRSQVLMAEKMHDDMKAKVPALETKFKRVRNADFPTTLELQQLIEEALEIEQLADFAVEALREAMGSMTRAGKLRRETRNFLQPTSKYLSSAVLMRKAAVEMKRAISVFAGQYD